MIGKHDQTVNSVKIKEKWRHVKAAPEHSGRIHNDRAMVADMWQALFGKSEPVKLKLDNIKAVLFDLDGTLVDVDMYRFIPGYLRRLTEQMRDLVNPVRATRSFHNAVEAMFNNEDAEATLEEVLLQTLQAELSIRPEQYAASLQSFCEHSLEELHDLVTGHVMAPDLLGACGGRGWQVVLATNPIFPRSVVDARLRWGGLDDQAFCHVTAYETAHYCKPKPEYFFEILDRLGCAAGQCLMVGNDPLHDLAAGQAGMQTCLLTPWSISRPGVGFKADWKGRHQELLTLFLSA